jgi:hypothetical protein
MFKPIWLLLKVNLSVFLRNFQLLPTLESLGIVHTKRIAQHLAPIRQRGRTTASVDQNKRLDYSSTLDESN